MQVTLLVINIYYSYSQCDLNFHVQIGSTLLKAPGTPWRETLANSESLYHFKNKDYYTYQSRNEKNHSTITVCVSAAIFYMPEQFMYWCWNMIIYKLWCHYKAYIPLIKDDADTGSDWKIFYFNNYLHFRHKSTCRKLRRINSFLRLKFSKLICMTSVCGHFGFLDSWILFISD